MRNFYPIRDYDGATSMRLHTVFMTFAALLISAAPIGASAQSNEGNEFYLTFLENLVAPPTIEVHLTGSEATTVSISYPAINPTFTNDAVITPGDVTIVQIPVDAAQDWTADLAQDNAVHLEADKNFVAYMANRTGSSSDAGLALPVSAFNREYILVTNRSTVSGSLFAVVAAYDDTTVTITPSQELSGGRDADTPFQVTLQSGEAYYGQATATSASGLTGTIVSSSRPVGVAQGDSCTNWPIGACDHNYDTAIPVQAWGTEILATNSPERAIGAAYKIVASKDDTEVSINGAVEGTINKGEFIELAQRADDFVISATEPIAVLQIQAAKAGGDPGPSGDPAISTLIPPAQFQSQYTFSTLDELQFSSNWVSVIAHNDDLNTIQLDGVPIGAGEFDPIGASEYSVARIAIAGGVHATSSNNPHGIMVVGYQDFNSYQYAGGTQLEAINNDGDILAPECSYTIIAGPPASAEVIGTDNRPAQIIDDEETEDTGIFQVNLLSGSENVTIDVPEFIPGDESVTAVVNLIDPDAPASATVEFRDGAGNNCEQEVLFVTDPECEETEIAETQMSMDGGAGVQRNIVRRLTQLLTRASGSATYSRSAREAAQSAYGTAWSSVWVIPSTLRNNCANPQFCEEVSLEDVRDQYLQATRELNRLVNRTIRRLRRLDNTPKRRAIRSLKRAAQESYSNNVSRANSLPTSYQSCEV